MNGLLSFILLAVPASLIAWDYYKEQPLNETYLYVLAGVFGLICFTKLYSYYKVGYGCSTSKVNNTAEGFNELFEGDNSSEKVIGKRQSKYDFMVDSFYNLVTDFYVWGWGESFHFGPRFRGEAFIASLARAEHFLASRLELKPGKKALDLGCGVGGPLRAITRFSGANVKGVTINQYQVDYTNKRNKATGLDHLCQAYQGDFQKLEETFGDELGTFDAAYAIEAIVHSPSFVDVYSQIYKMLKPGGLFGTYEWVMTDKYDPKDPTHVRIKEGIEHGNAIPTLHGPQDVLTALKQTGFEVLEHYNANANSEAETETPWYYMLEGRLSFQGFRMTKIGRFFTSIMLFIMETLWIAPKGTCKVQKFLCIAADNLAEGGQQGIFTPTYYVLARKPL